MLLTCSYVLHIPQTQVHQATIDSAWSLATSRPKSLGYADDSFRWRPPVLGRQDVKAIWFWDVLDLDE